MGGRRNPLADVSTTLVSDLSSLARLSQMRRAGGSSPPRHWVRVNNSSNWSMTRSSARGGGEDSLDDTAETTVVASPAHPSGPPDPPPLRGSTQTRAPRADRTRGTCRRRPSSMRHRGLRHGTAGINPAWTNDDLPDPDGPTTAISFRSLNSPTNSDTASERPKKSSVSASRNADSPL